MARELTWDDAEDIGILLAEKHPGLCPLTLRFTDLHRYVTELAGFNDDPKKSNEGKLEAIQMAWQEEFQAQACTVEAAKGAIQSAKRRIAEANYVVCDASCTT